MKQIKLGLFKKLRTNKIMIMLRWISYLFSNKNFKLMKQKFIKLKLILKFWQRLVLVIDVITLRLQQVYWKLVLSVNTKKWNIL